jgi:hypothetical protein
MKEVQLFPESTIYHLTEDGVMTLCCLTVTDCPQRQYAPEHYGLRLCSFCEQEKGRKQ